MAESQTLETIRRILLVTLVASLIGVEVELILLEHVKPLLQVIPVFLIALALGAISWYAFSRNAKSMRIFQGTMFLCVFSGFLGIVLHLAFDVSKVSKQTPGLFGYPLLRAALQSSAPPLAPAAMIEIGLVGLAYTFKHPAMDTGIENHTPSIIGK